MEVRMLRPLNRMTTRRHRRPWLKSSHPSMSQRVEQTELLCHLMTNSSREGTVVTNARDQARSSYVEFLATQLPTFTEASKPLKADHWLCTIESMFKLLNYTEIQKMLFAAQQLLGDARACWANFTTTRPANQVQWTQFREAFHRNTFHQAS
jgi:hypothetical protein